MNVYERIFDQHQILDGSNQPVKDVYSDRTLWLEQPGCAIHCIDFQLPADLRTEGIVKPGLYLSIVLQGTGVGGPMDGDGRQAFGDNDLIAMVLRAPTNCGSAAPAGSYLRAVDIAFPLASIRTLGLEADFMALFGRADQDRRFLRVKAPPRVQAVAAEMLTPVIEGHPGRLLLGAQATEILTRSMFVLRQQIDLDGPTGAKRDRLQAIRELMQSDLGYPWSIAELADRAGFSRRNFNLQFRAAYGVSASDYLRGLRLDAARDALVHQNMSIADAAYQVGYTHPANFATAFRRRFGCPPSQCRDDKIA